MADDEQLKIIKLGVKELELHKNYLKSNLKSNFYD